MKATCRKGHPYTVENTMWRIMKGKRLYICRTCNRARNRTDYAFLRAILGVGKKSKLRGAA